MCVVVHQKALCKGASPATTARRVGETRHRPALSLASFKCQSQIGTSVFSRQHRRATTQLGNMFSLENVATLPPAPLPVLACLPLVSCLRAVAALKPTCKRSFPSFPASQPSQTERQHHTHSFLSSLYQASCSLVKNISSPPPVTNISVIHT